MTDGVIVVHDSSGLPLLKHSVIVTGMMEDALAMGAFALLIDVAMDFEAAVVDSCDESVAMGSMEQSVNLCWSSRRQAAKDVEVVETCAMM